MASSALRKLVEERAPRRPYCADEKHQASIRSQEIGLASAFLQLNPPAHQAWLVLDADERGAAHAWEDAGLPAPTYVAINRKNGHAHIGYALAAPVCTTMAARLEPLRYLAAIEHAYTVAARADFAFAGHLAKNPLSDRWLLWEPANAPEYELGYLAEFVNLPSKLPPRPAGVGRNCELFDALRRWAYTAVREFWRPGGEDAWQEAIKRQAAFLNTFSEPLGWPEVNGIARSVARYVWRRFSPRAFQQVQAARGRKSGLSRFEASEDKRASARLMASHGHSTRKIATALGVHQSTVCRWLAQDASNTRDAVKAYPFATTACATDA